MSKISTIGKRYLEDDVWHDANGVIPGNPREWDPPMTEAEKHEAALSDPDNPPLSPEQLAGFKRTALAKRLRFRLKLSREEFAEAYRIPSETLRLWERHELDPTPVELAYLEAIERGEVKPRQPA
jgi:DNA-binding transcriptional regulator YiaG